MSHDHVQPPLEGVHTTNQSINIFTPHQKMTCAYWLIIQPFCLRWEMTHHVCCIKSRRKKSGFLSEYLIKDESDDSGEEYDLDYICSCKQISYFKRDKNGDPAVSIHRGKCKFPTPIAYQTHTRLKQTDYPNFNLVWLITVPHGPELACWFL